MDATNYTVAAYVLGGALLWGYVAWLLVSSRMACRERGEKANGGEQ